MVNGRTQEGMNGAQEAFHSRWGLLAGLAARWLRGPFFSKRQLGLNFNNSQVSVLLAAASYLEPLLWLEVQKHRPCLIYVKRGNAY